MLVIQVLKLEDIYVPARFRSTLAADKVDSIAESIIENGQQTPIQVRLGKGRYVLVTGFHRLEALRALGEDTVQALVVQARKH